MNKNDLFELTITDMGTDGEGIGHYDGMTFFVKDALIGDVITARALKLKKNYGYARVEEIKSPSTFRVEAECPLHRSCGGCQIQALSYDKQLEFKNEKVRNNIIRIGGFDPEFIDSVMQPVVGMDKPYRYRNKAQFPVGKDRNGKLVTGFYASRTHSIIPVTDCLLGVKENEKILDIVKSWMGENHIEPYNEETHKGLVRHVLIRFGFTSKEIMVCLIINGKSLPASDSLCEKLSEIPGMTSVSYNVNTEKTNVILGKRTECIWGQPYISDTIHLRTYPDFKETGLGIEYQISPQSFYQVNPEQTEKLYSTALEFAGLTGKESVWDLYCGIGTISLFLSQKAKQVYGVEIVPQAIEDAKNNARLNGITNAEFFVGKAEEVLPEFYANAAGDAGTDMISADGNNGEDTNRCMDGRNRDMLRPDVIVVDPPRKGCDERCLDTMLKMAPDRIVYVSCDSATLARDLKILCQGGYEIRKIQVFDQFAHSVHVETVCLLSQRKADDYLEVEIDLDELDATSAETKATYEQIKKYVAENNEGMKVSNLYIAQVKKKCGIELGQNFNLPKSESAKQPQCPKEKEDAIVEALKAFQMIG